jgi:hypothetical protein
MWIFIISGILYLVGIAIVLILKPSYMFTPDGHWKEFGIGQREDRYTPFPFWLFCLVWALVAYFLVLFICTFCFYYFCYLFLRCLSPLLSILVNFRRIFLLFRFIFRLSIVQSIINLHDLFRLLFFNSLS